MSWSINELDKNKTEQSISNEEARLDTCRETLDKLKKEYNQKVTQYDTELYLMHQNIIKISKSIESGEKFIKECKKHLKDFD